MTMPRFRALVVDDEAPARRKIRFYLRGMSDIEIAGECRTGAAAIAAVERDVPHILFLDVQMPDLSGFDVVSELHRRGRIPPAIVFVTAHEEFAVRAFEVMALDYLLKPFSQERFERAVERARASLATPDVAAMQASLRRLLETVETRPGRDAHRLLIRAGEETVVVPARDIRYIRAAGDSLEVHAAGRTYTLRRTITELEEELPPSMFVRIHRSTIVNVRHVRSLSPLFNKDHVVTLHDGARLTASRTYYDRLVAALAGTQ